LNEQTARLSADLSKQKIFVTTKKGGDEKTLRRIFRVARSTNRDERFNLAHGNSPGNLLCIYRDIYA